MIKIHTVTKFVGVFVRFSRHFSESDHATAMFVLSFLSFSPAFKGNRKKDKLT
jgi:hypothetical protein